MTTNVLTSPGAQTSTSCCYIHCPRGRLFRVILYSIRQATTAPHEIAANDEGAVRLVRGGEKEYVRDPYPQAVMSCHVVSCHRQCHVLSMPAASSSLRYFLAPQLRARLCGADAPWFLPFPTQLENALKKYALHPLSMPT